jgi:capsular polysaccharide biosynthesis protein
VTRQVVIRLVESYFRHRWLYLLPILFMVVVAGLSYVITKPKYLSEGVLYVQKESLLASLNAVGANNSAIWGSPAQITGWEINALVQTDAFIRAVIQQTSLEKDMGAGQDSVATLIKDVRKDVWATPLGDNQIQISGSYKDPIIASQLADGVMKGYLQWKLNGSLAQSGAAQGFFNDLIKGYKSDLDTARLAMKTYIEAHPQPLRGDRPELEQIEIKRLQGDIDQASNRLGSALDKEENARLAQAQSESDVHQTYILIDAPKPPLKPETSLKQIGMNFGIFIAVGLILSLTAIVGGALLDRSIRFPYDVTNSLNLQLLAIVPEVNQTAEKMVKKARVKKTKSLSEKGVSDGALASENILIAQPNAMIISEEHGQGADSAVDLKG